MKHKKKHSLKRTKQLLFIMLLLGALISFNMKVKTLTQLHIYTSFSYINTISTKDKKKTANFHISHTKVSLRRPQEKQQKKNKILKFEEKTSLWSFFSNIKPKSKW